MALELKIEKDSISSDCTTLTIKDNTGNYNVSTNPHGYGSPNETRANLFIKLFVTLKKTDGDEAQTIDAYDENTEDTWEIDITEDGYYEIFSFACKAWNSGTTYAAGHIVYSSGTDSFYKSLQASNTNHAVTDASWWEVTTDIDDFNDALDLVQPNTYGDIYNFAEVCNSNVCLARKMADGECCDCDPSEVQDYEKIRWKLEQVEVNVALERFTKAQEIIETIQPICDC
jgi:hypothetical protein